MQHDLVPDIYIEIYKHIKSDARTTASWFLCCKAFHVMVRPEFIRFHSMINVISRDGAYWPHLISRLAMRWGQLGVLWRSEDYKELNERDYPQEVWNKILNNPLGSQDDMETCEYIINEMDDSPSSERLIWYVYRKQCYKFYTRKGLKREEVYLGNYSENDFENKYHCQGEFIRDEINWYVYDRA